MSFGGVGVNVSRVECGAAMKKDDTGFPSRRRRLRRLVNQARTEGGSVTPNAFTADLRPPRRQHSNLNEKRDHPDV